MPPMFSKPTSPQPTSPSRSQATRPNLFQTAPIWRSASATLARILRNALGQNGCPSDTHNIFDFEEHPLVGGTHGFSEGPAALPASSLRPLPSSARLSEDFELESTPPAAPPSAPKLRASPKPHGARPSGSAGSRRADGPAPPESPVNSQKDVAARIVLQEHSSAELRNINSFINEYPLTTNACLKLSSQSHPSDAPTHIDPSGFDTESLIAAGLHIRQLQVGVETITISASENAAAGGPSGAQLAALLTNPASRDNAIAKYILSHADNYRVTPLELALGVLPILDACLGILTERHFHTGPTHNQALTDAAERLTLLAPGDHLDFSIPLDLANAIAEAVTYDPSEDASPAYTAVI